MRAIAWIATHGLYTGRAGVSLVDHHLTGRNVLAAAVELNVSHTVSERTRRHPADRLAELVRLKDRWRPVGGFSGRQSGWSRCPVESDASAAGARRARGRGAGGLVGR